MEPCTPAVASALHQLGLRCGGRAAGCSLGSLSLGSGRGLSGINPCCPKEQTVLRKTYLPTPFSHIRRLLLFWDCSSCLGWEGGSSLLQASASDWVRVRSLAQGICLPTGTCPPMLWSPSPGRLCRASLYRTCECVGRDRARGPVCVRRVAMYACVSRTICHCVCVQQGRAGRCLISGNCVVSVS